MKALFVSELGGGYGNVGPLVHIAAAMELEGVRPIFALSDAVTPATLFTNRPWPVLPAPALRDPLRPRPGPASYGDILATCGFAEPEMLAALVTQWDALFALTQPDFIVASHAPSAILAARGRLPVIAVGTGFTLPPSHTATFPALRPDTMSFRPEFAALEAANAVLAMRRAPKLSTLPALLAVEARLVASVRELDPYAPLRKDAYVQLTPHQPSIMRANAPGVFAFMDIKGPESMHAVECLADIAKHLPVETHLRGPGAKPASAFLNRCGVRTHLQPVPMAEALSRARVIVSQGGHGTCLSTLMAARASVVLPAHFESMLNGLALERLGVGKVAWGGETSTILEHLEWALDLDPRVAQTAADRVAEPYALDVSALLSHMRACGRRAA